MTQLQTELDSILSGVVGDTPNTDLDAILDRVAGPTTPLSPTLTAVEMFEQEHTIDPPMEDIFGFVTTQAGRGVLQLKRQVGGLERMEGRIVKKIVGDNPLSAMFEKRGSEAQAEAERALHFILPRRTDETTFRKVVGGAFEALPGFAVQVGAAGAAGAVGGPVAAFAAFAGTAAGPVAGGQYLDTLRETGNPDQAILEAVTAGIITVGTSIISFKGLFGEIPGADRIFTTVARRMAARFVAGEVGEFSQEIAEGVLTEFAIALIREDSEMAMRVLTLDPDFWGPVFLEGLSAALLGGPAGVAIQGHVELQAKVARGEAMTAADLEIARAVILLTLPEQQIAVEAEPTEAAAPAAPAVPPTPSVAPESEAPEVTEAAPPVPPPIPPTVPPVTTEPAAEPGPPETIMETEELVEQLQETRRAGREAVRQARQKGRDEATVKFEERLERVVRRAQDIEAARTELSEAVKERFGKNVPSNITQQLGKVKTRAQLENALQQVEKEVSKLRRREVVGRVRTAFKKLKKADLIPRVQEAVDALLSDVNLNSLTDEHRTELQRIRDATEGTDVPARLERQLDRLERTDIKDLDVEDILTLSLALESMLGANARVQKARQQAEAQRSETAQAAMATEIGARAKPLKITPEGRQKVDRRSTLGGFTNIAVGTVPNTTPDTLASILGGDRKSVTWTTLSDDVDQSMDGAAAIYYELEGMLQQGIDDLGVKWGGRDMAAMSADLASPRNVLAKILKSLGSDADFRTTADVIAYTLSNGQSVKLTRMERAALLATLERRRARDQIIHRGVGVKLKSNPAKLILLSVADWRMIQTSTPDVNTTELDNQIVQLSLDILNGSARQLISEWSIQRVGWDITAAEDVYYPTRRENQTEPPLSGSAFIRSTMQQMSIVQPTVPDAKAPYIIGDLLTEVIRYFDQVSMLTQAGPKIEFAHKQLHGQQVQAILTNSKDGKDITKRFDRLYEQLANDAGAGARPELGAFVNRVQKLVTNVQVGALGINETVAAYQTVSSLMATLQQNAAPIMQSIATGAEFDLRINKRMNQYGWLRRRNSASNIGLIQEGGSFTQKLGKRSGAREMFMVGLRLMDMTAIRIIWRAAEIEVGAKLDKDGLLSKDDLKKVSRIAGDTIKRTQPTFDTMHLTGTGLEARQNAVVKLAISMFRAQLSKNLDQVHDGINTGNATKVVAVLALQAVLIAAIAEFRDRVIRQRDKKLGVVESIAATALQRFIGNAVLGDFINFMVDVATGLKGFEPRNIASGVFISGMRSVKRLRIAFATGDSDAVIREGIDATMELLVLFGIPLRTQYKNLQSFFKEPKQEGRAR